MVLAGAAGAIAVLLTLAWTQQRRVLYFPGSEPGPAPAGWTEVAIPTEDGLELSGWYRGLRGGDSGPVIVVFPGNAGNRANRVRLGNALAGRDSAVLLVDYRGYGGNPGAPSESGLTTDARAAHQYLRRIHPADPIIYVGESLGAAVATELAVESPPDALILLSPFTSLADVSRFHFPLAFGFLIRDSYPSLQRFESGALNDIPVLVIAGSADSLIPVAQSRAIAQAAGAELHEVEGVDHNNPAIRSDPAVVNRMTEFIRRSIGESPTATASGAR